MNARWPSALIVALVATSSPACWGEQVRVDLLSGIGDFEYSSETAWNSGYQAQDSYFAAQGGWYSAANPMGWRYGYKPATADDSVAVGWVRRTGERVSPATQSVFKVVGGGIGGSNCQYMALRNLSGSGAADLSASVRVGSKPGELRAGDRVVFRVDHLRISDYAQAASLRCILQLSWSRPSPSNPAVSESVVKETIVTPTGGSVSASVSGTLDATSGTVLATIRLEVSGIGSSQPGVFVDGARIWVQRSGATGYQMEDKPYPRNRAIKTFKIFFDPITEDPREIALDYDYVMFKDDGDYARVPLLKSLNPAIKLYQYEFCGVSDVRDSRGIDAYFSNTPLGFGDVAKSHPGWLYANGTGGYVKSEGATHTYYARVADAAYASVWADIASRTASARRFDGVWIDGVTSATALTSGSTLLRPKQEPWEMQRFLHAVVPVLRRAGLEALQNACMRRPHAGEGQVYLDPFWTPRSPYSSAQYAANSPSMAPNSFCQEWAFFVYDDIRLRNRYDRDYWRSTLDDMDKIRDWNLAVGTAALSGDQKRSMLAYCLGTDRADDPAYGQDGWLRFGLCSYLLGQNDWTTFGCGIRPSGVATMDYSITKRLGVPDGEHQAYSQDQYHRYRRYKPTPDGGVGGVVVVNGHADTSRSYLTEFDALDESGTFIARGTRITMKPHTGRCFLQGSNAVQLAVQVPTAVVPGQIVDVVVQYSNTWSIDIRNVVIRATVPAGASYLNGSAEATGGAWSSSTNEVAWVIDSISAGQSGTRVFRVTVK